MATRNNGGPPCPKVERLEELMEFLTELKRDALNDPDLHELKDEILAQNDTLQECVEVLDWLHTMLSNRQTYHKVRNAKQKIFMEAATKILGEDEIKAIQQQAEREVAKNG